MQLMHEGKSLCSQRDPLREANTWASDIPFFPEIAVLGLGAGFHLNALARRHPSMKIVVFDHRLDLIRNFNNSIKSDPIGNIEIHAVAFERIGDQNLKLFQFAKIFYPSIQAFEPNYETLKRILLGKEPSAFLKFARIYGMDFLRPERASQWAEVNIKVAHDCLMPNKNSQSALLLSALRELVK